ncbi:unnamed protein product [Linum trigynum]|uniref:Uncharacterized protein n=1 Tax=Linum trigynum TaxID=586398 RepID=A0AAV2EE12_9ROSI
MDYACDMRETYNVEEAEVTSRAGIAVEARGVVVEGMIEKMVEERDAEGGGEASAANRRIVRAYVATLEDIHHTS